MTFVVAFGDEHMPGRERQADRPFDDLKQGNRGQYAWSFLPDLPVVTRGLAIPRITAGW